METEEQTETSTQKTIKETQNKPENKKTQYIQLIITAMMFLIAFSIVGLKFSKEISTNNQLNISCEVVKQSQEHCNKTSSAYGYPLQFMYNMLDNPSISKSKLIKNTLILIIPSIALTLSLKKLMKTNYILITSMAATAISLTLLAESKDSINVMIHFLFIAWIPPTILALSIFTISKKTSFRTSKISPPRTISRKIQKKTNQKIISLLATTLVLISSFLIYGSTDTSIEKISKVLVLLFFTSLTLTILYQILEVKTMKSTQRIATWLASVNLLLLITYSYYIIISTGPIYS